MGNVLDKLPKVLHAKAKDMLHDQYLSPTSEDALKAFEVFIRSFGDKYSKAFATVQLRLINLVTSPSIIK
jgi:transposase-like protein